MCDQTREKMRAAAEKFKMRDGAVYPVYLNGRERALLRSLVAAFWESRLIATKHIMDSRVDRLDIAYLPVIEMNRDSMRGAGKLLRLLRDPVDHGGRPCSGVDE